MARQAGGKLAGLAVFEGGGADVLEGAEDRFAGTEKEPHVVALSKMEGRLIFIKPVIIEGIDHGGILAGGKSGGENAVGHGAGVDNSVVRIILQFIEVRQSAGVLKGIDRTTDSIGVDHIPVSGIQAGNFSGRIAKGQPGHADGVTFPGKGLSGPGPAHCLDELNGGGGKMAAGTATKRIVIVNGISR